MGIQGRSVFLGSLKRTRRKYGYDFSGRTGGLDQKGISFSLRQGVANEYGDFAVIEQFAHGGMSSGGVDNEWWMNEGIPLLKSRLTKP